MPTSFSYVTRRRRMHADQDDTALPHPFPSLDRDLPEVPVKREQNSAIRLGPLQNVLVTATREIVTRPQDIVAGEPQVLNDPSRKILIGEKLHLRREGIGPEFVRKVTGVGKTGEQILARQTGVVREQLAFGLSGGEKL